MVQSLEFSFLVVVGVTGPGGGSVSVAMSRCLALGWLRWVIAVSKLLQNILIHSVEYSTKAR